METERNLIVQVLALVVVAVAVVVVYRLTRNEVSARMAQRAGPAAGPAPTQTRGAERRITYRFLYPDEPGAVAGKLTLARFFEGHLCEDRTWESRSVVHWCSWAAGLFARENGWAAEDQPGWQISRWLRADEPSKYDEEHLFWSIQALRFLDRESTANKIAMIEKSGKTAHICLARRRSDYDYGADTLYWNPGATSHTGADDRPGPVDPLIALACQLSHMCHDFCQDGDSRDDQERKRVAAAAEDRLRAILSRKDPTYARLRPEPNP